MRFAPRFAAIVLTLGLGAGLTGCGFHLVDRGTHNAPLAYQHMKLNLPSSSSVLGDKLKIYLTGDGVKFDNNSEAYTLHVIDYNYRRQKLSGRVAEVLLHLNVTFQIEDKNGQPITEPRTISSTKSYQYNVATVNVDDNEQDYLINMLIDDVAQQMARQISTNRLPLIQSTSTPSSSVTP
ncbi:LPS assembly lipoprotein LptE [Acinetobacter sp. MD2(2019)]|uniref:LPS-assembly lipoprotein LptE n=1 Tax=Acinetobacter sp. MD2(2019) TaxID=2605273 RepID=UPI002D1EDED2|nr:LPS assembly lipoprotein LptE [Acinetobacter sp. MD2(2019)]MEB3753580.1 hypothetical protein [Acinetobacter sp. MD2(2019)]